jgi:predicted DCC family thiol-disulfide oxidoreductase YuxK
VTTAPSTSEAPPLVLYNGSCPVCSREIASYRRLAARCGAALDFVDASRDDEALATLGLDADRAARRLHLLENGRLLAGVEAFAALWDRLPGWRLLARLIRLPGVRAFAEFVYEGILAPLLYRWHERRLSRERVASR